MKMSTLIYHDCENFTYIERTGIAGIGPMQQEKKKNKMCQHLRMSTISVSYNQERTIISLAFTKIKLVFISSSIKHLKFIRLQQKLMKSPNNKQNRDAYCIRKSVQLLSIGTILLCFKVVTYFSSKQYRYGNK